MSRSIIGFHYGPGADNFKKGIGDFMDRLNEKDIPFFMKGADHAGICFEGQELAKKTGVSNWLLYRTSTRGQEDGNDYDVPDYLKSPEEAALEHWHITLAKWPKELDPDIVWMEPINEPRAKPDEDKGIFEDMHPVDWLGRFMLAYAKIANNASPQRFKVCGPSFNSGEPEVIGTNEYELPGMLDYLRYCAANPDLAALSVHEYIWDRWEPEKGESWEDWYPSLWGRVEAAFAAADKHNIARDFHVFVTEWGFSYNNSPRWPDCEPLLKLYDAWAARWPQVKGAAAWSLQGGIFLGAAKDLHTWIGPLTDYILDNDFDPGPQPAAVHSDFGQTSPSEPEPEAPRGLLAYTVKSFALSASEEQLRPGQKFTATWKLDIAGSEAWRGDFEMAYVDTSVDTTKDHQRMQMAAKPVFSLQELTGRNNIQPGHEIILKLEMTAPEEPGRYASHWQLRTASGKVIGGTRFLFYDVRAKEEVAEGPEPPGPAVPSGPFDYRGPKVTFFTGLHGPADDFAWTRDGFKGLINKLNLPLVFMSNGINPDHADVGDPKRNVVRLYWNPRKATADEAYEEIRDDQLKRWWEKGYKRFIFFNEPQLRKADSGQSEEGMGIAWHSADEFARYLNVCLSRANAEFPGIHLFTTPVTSNEAFDPWGWRAAIWKHNRREVKGWCMHAYTGNNSNVTEAVNDILGQVKELQSRFNVQVPIIVSEASVNRGDDAKQKAKVALKLAKQAAKMPGLEAVYWYAADWDPDFDHHNEGWFRKGIAEEYLRLRV